MQIQRGATLTGGSSITYSKAASGLNESVYVGPDHSRLTADVIRVTVGTTPAKGSNPSFGRSGFSVERSEPQETEGCCTVAVNSARIDMGVRMVLADGSETLVDEVVATVRALVYHADFPAWVKSGTFPA